MPLSFGPSPFRRSLSVKVLFSLCFVALLAACGDDSQQPDDGSTSHCGNGKVESGEQCDDGNTDSGDGCSATCQNETTAVCGNSAVETGEQCDDGNTDSGDGCSATCQNETTAVCGNSAVETGEQCDDGNTQGGDGCSATCQNEVPGICGNGVKDDDEACDDGNAIPLDGCESDCTISPEEVVCGTLAPIATTCEVTPGNDTKLIEGDILGPYTILRGGQVVIDPSGKITCAACDCSAMSAGATTISCPQAVVSPGLINTHEHITYAQNSPYTDTGERYEQRHDWRKGLHGHTKIPAPGGATADQVRWGELRFLMSGATSLVGSGSATGFLRNLDKNDQEGLGLTPPVDFDTFPLGDSGGQQIDSGCGYPNIVTQQSIAGDSAYLPHISEGIDSFAHNEFLCVDDDRMTHDVVEPESAFIHAVGLNPSDYAEMATAGTSLIWSPRSNITLYGNTAEVTAASRVGVNIALGTDWIPTGSMNMQRELTCASELNTTYYGGFFTDRDLWRMTTAGAAKAIHADQLIGSLRPTLVGDIAIYDAKTHHDYRAIIDGEPKDVALVLRGGKPLYGDDAVIDALTTSGSCDAVDVCTTDKRICASDDIGKTYQALKTSVGASIYYNFPCGQPTNEPSCVPTRPVAVNNSTVYTGVPSASDSDGDGIPDASDNCPTVFNPVRPMDNGVQPDFDGDGDGDACDPCPLNANTTTCTPLGPGDSDGDGIPNASDNCPADPNPLQEDADGDMKGDACDACPNDSNPGNAACPATIYEIKQGVITGTVALNHALVTACKASRGYFLQAKPGDAGYMGSDFSGIFVFEPAADCVVVKPGDRVDISSATVSDFFGQTELIMAVAAVTSSGEALPPPVSVTAANAAGAVSGPLEGVLVTVPNVSVTDLAPAPGPGDSAPTNEFEVAGVLRVNDFIYLVSPFPTDGASFTSITGILDYRNSQMKLEPRSASDYVYGAPALNAFSTPLAFTRVGLVNASALPVPLTVSLTSPAQGDTFVAIADVAGVVTVTGGGVTILDGQTSGEVFLSGLAQNAGVTLTATLGANDATTQIRVLGATEQPTTLVLSPNMVSLAPGGTATLEAQIDIPAPPGGITVALSVNPGSAGSVPATVLIPADQTSATFTFTDASMVSTSQILASYAALTAQADVTISTGSTGLVINEVDYDNVGTDNAEFVEIYNPTASPISLANVGLVMVNGANNAEYQRTDLTPVGSLGAGQYLVVGSSSVIAGVMAPALSIHFNGAGDTDRIQNGGPPSPDAMALVNLTTGDLIDALSYEGAVNAGIVNGFGAKDFVEAPVLPATTADSNSAIGSLSRLPNGQDTNHAASDWQFTSTPTPGTINQ